MSGLALSVVIPAFNEASRIENTLAHSLTYLDRRGFAYEVVVVDDGSSDDTAERVAAFAKQSRGKVELVRLSQNRGKGAALRNGFAVTRGARVLMMDADLATPIEELEVLEAAIDAGAQVASGSRAVSSSKVRRAQSPLRVMLGRAGNLWIRAWAVPGIHDTQCGFKLFDGAVGRTLFALTTEDRFGIDIEVLCLAQRHLGVSVVEVGVAWEHQHGSKVRPRDYIDVLVKVPRIVLQVAWRQRK